MDTPVGIEALNAYLGSARLNVRTLAEARGLDMDRFDGLLMVEKTVPMPYEDPVSQAVNAARPIVNELSDAKKKRIELVISCTETGIDFGKSVASYVHDLLGLGRNCRVFEVKQACYCGTAGLQMAAGFVLSQVSPGAKALVVATDLTRFMVAEGSSALSQDWSYAEPSSGAGAVAMLVSDRPTILHIDAGCSGYYGYEVMDTCRPVPDSEAGDADLSLLSYLDCCENAYREYEKRVEGIDYLDSFHRLAFHTPFGGMVKGAHRNMMRKFKKVGPQQIEADFRQRVEPGLRYCQRVGNIMGGSLYLALASAIDNAACDENQRVGLFSYGSGCCSEFFSGVVTPEGKAALAARGLEAQLSSRRPLTMGQYEQLLRANRAVAFGTRNMVSDYHMFPGVWECFEGTGKLVLKGIREFHREYEWV
jgi:polyketide biosynthesis 3-hydroxy-3-methylglutaryl-CoA synthase-like enzyme PksG